MKTTIELDNNIYQLDENGFPIGTRFFTTLSQILKTHYRGLNPIQITRVSKYVIDMFNTLHEIIPLDPIDYSLVLYNLTTIRLANIYDKMRIFQVKYNFQYKFPADITSQCETHEQYVHYFVQNVNMFLDYYKDNLHDAAEFILTTFEKSLMIPQHYFEYRRNIPNLITENYS